MIFKFSKKQAIIAIVFLFISTQIIGLYTASQYMHFISIGELSPVFENPESVMNSFALVAYIMMMTVLLILVIKLKKSLIKVLEAIAIFFTSAIVFSFMFPTILGLGELLALILTAWKMIKPTYFKQNIALIFSVSGAGAVMGASFGVFPVLVFIFLLSVYDFISVFITKHMVYMAKAITETPTAFTAAIPCKKPNHVFQLGGGDLVMPLVFSASVLNYHGFTSMLFTSVGALIALFLLFYWVMNKPGNALPALPPICAGASIGFFISLVI